MVAWPWWAFVIMQVFFGGFMHWRGYEYRKWEERRAAR